MENKLYNDTLQKIERANASVGVIGLGYVGLPLAAAAARGGMNVLGFDVDPKKIDSLTKGHSYIDAVDDAELRGHVDAERFEATDDFHRLAECDVVVICVPTPLTKSRDPDLSYVENTATSIAKTLRHGQIIVLESTTYPGTTEEILKPILESSGLIAGVDFWIGFSPEREDPGNKGFNTASIPKVVAGDGKQASNLLEAFYSRVVKKVVPVSSPSVAEAVKITENVFRSVNIALVNELKVIYDKMGIDVWEVIDAAATKPFGYMPFYPGPGLGGHCIPIDPFYLSWKAREYGQTAHFIELAGEINVSMPNYVIANLRRHLDLTQGMALSRAKVLVLGLAYKKNVADVRESPSLMLLQELERIGCCADFHDQHVVEIPGTREFADLAGKKSVLLSAEAISKYHAVLIATDHDNVDYELLHAHAKLIVDTRNAMAKRKLIGDHIFKS